jgi:hypothetical protein
MPSATPPSCSDTVLAVIYTGLQESCFASAPDAEALAQDIAELETLIWKHSRERYLGIFPMVGPAAHQFAKLGKFHVATHTCHVVAENFLEPLQDHNGTTHVLIVGTAAATIALEAKKQGLHTCIFQPATRGLYSVEELTAAGVVIAEDGATLNSFLDAALARRAGVHPYIPECVCDAIMDKAGAPPAWCAYKSNNFLWRTTMRLRRALSAVTAEGFDGVWPPYKEKDPALRYKGRWRCTEAEKVELGEAIDQASGAGIYIGDAMSIYSYTPLFEQLNWHTFWLLKEEHDRTKEANAALKEEVERLKAQLAGEIAEKESGSFIGRLLREM